MGPGCSRRAGLRQVEVIEGDAAVSDIYHPIVPADLILACGIFGNIADGDIERTARNVSMLCRPGAAVVWTRHRNEPDVTPASATGLRKAVFGS